MRHLRQDTWATRLKTCALGLALGAGLLAQAPPPYTQPVIYLTLASSANDYAATALNLVTGTLSALAATTYDLFGGTGSDSLVVSRNGQWGLLTNFQNNQIALGPIDPATGVLTSPTLYPVGNFPVSVCVVGAVN